MRNLVLLAAVVAGCRFGVSSVDVEMGVPLDGGVPDANLEMSVEPAEAGVEDFASSAPDLHRKAPDGAVPRKPGFPCSTANECDNGFCIDGFCCDDLCDPLDPANQCRACNVTGAEGHCTFAQDGTDPRGLCDQEATTTCGRDGLCNGLGACRLWGAATSCGSSTCSAGQVTAPPMCDGQGHCNASGISADCSPYDCAGNACATTCTASGGCAPAATCTGFGQCDGKGGLGAICLNPGDCASGFCSQGVCCATDCSGVCQSCSLPMAKGLCVMVADGADPFDQCTSMPRSTCNLDGFCDGNGSCRLWSSQTVCAAASCSVDTSTATRFCDGSGTCLPSGSTDCRPYTCDPATGNCFAEPCSNDNQCSAGDKCKKSGKCGPP